MCPCAYTVTVSCLSLYKRKEGVRGMVFNATFNNISVLLVKETGEHMSGIQTHNFSGDRD